MKRLQIRCHIVLLFLVLATLPSYAQPAAPANLDAYVARVQEAFEVPGISLAIVQDGKVVVAEGYGVRKLGDATTVIESARMKAFSPTTDFSYDFHDLLLKPARR